MENAYINSVNLNKKPTFLTLYRMSRAMKVIRAITPFRSCIGMRICNLSMYLESLKWSIRCQNAENHWWKYWINFAFGVRKTGWPNDLCGGRYSEHFLLSNDWSAKIFNAIRHRQIGIDKDKIQKWKYMKYKTEIRSCWPTFWIFGNTLSEQRISSFRMRK